MTQAVSRVHRQLASVCEVDFRRGFTGQAIKLDRATGTIALY